MSREDAYAGRFIWKGRLLNRGGHVRHTGVHVSCHRPRLGQFVSSTMTDVLSSGLAPTKPTVVVALRCFIALKCYDSLGIKDMHVRLLHDDRAWRRSHRPVLEGQVARRS